ncbi:MAG: hypothetical protein M1815_004058 [Lichina confinis]|nr:MAG: hypothetical protein M1815_004058 [Lichina confinis]
MPPATRPQTLKQVKASYRKSGGRPRLSEQERRQLHRQAELDDRAAKIREKEKRRLENKRRRDEKSRKEREAALKTGLKADITSMGKTRDGSDRLEKYFCQPGHAGKSLDEQGPREEPSEADSLEAAADGEGETPQTPTPRPSRSVEEGAPVSQSRQRGGLSPVLVNEGLKSPPSLGRRKRAAEDDAGNGPPVRKRPREDAAAGTPGTQGTPIAAASQRRTPRPRAPASAPKTSNPPTTGVLTPRHPNIIAPVPRKTAVPSMTQSKSLLDGWEDALINSSEIERELATPERPKACGRISPRRSPIDDQLTGLPPLSTQELELTADDLAEIAGHDRQRDPAGGSMTSRTVVGSAKLEVEIEQGDCAAVTSHAGLDKSPSKSSYDSAGIDEALLEAFF